MGPDAVHMDEESHFWKRDASPEGCGGIWQALFQTERKGEWNSLVSVSQYPFHYDQNIKAHTLAQRGEESPLRTDLYVNNKDEYASNSPEEQKFLFARVQGLNTMALATSSSRLKPNFALCYLSDLGPVIYFSEGQFINKLGNNNRT